MKTYLSSLQYAQWAMLIALEMYLLSLLLWRRAHRELPAFTLYVGLLCSKSWMLLILSLYAGLETYFYAYWIGQAVVSCALLCVVVEVFEEVCLPGLLCSPAHVRILTNVSMLVAFLAAWLPQRTIAPTRLAVLNALIASEKAFGYVTSAVLGCLFIFAAAKGLSWTRRTLGITAGIILSTAFTALIDSQTKYFPGPWRVLLSQLSYAGSAASLCVWLAIVIRSTKVADEVLPKLSTEVGEALQWAHTFQRVVGNRLATFEYSHRR